MAGDFSSDVSGAIGGAEIGGEIGGPVGGFIGAGIGLLSSVFSTSPLDKYRNAINAMKKKAMQNLQSQTTANISFATTAGRRKAMAEGRDSESASMIAPGVGKAEEVGANASDKLNEYYDNLMNEANIAEMGKPSTGDVIGQIGKAATSLDQSNSLISAKGGTPAFNPFSALGNLFKSNEQPD